MEDQAIVHSYELAHAIEDGVLVECFSSRWSQLSGGKPIVATTRVSTDLSQAALMEIWNGYVAWRQQVRAALPEEEQMYTTTMNGRAIWVVEDSQAFTILYPQDY